MKISIINRLLDSSLEDDIQLALEYIKYMPLTQLKRIINTNENSHWKYHSRVLPKGTIFTNKERYIVKRRFILFWNDCHIFYAQNMGLAKQLENWGYTQEFLTPKIKQK